MAAVLTEVWADPRSRPGKVAPVLFPALVGVAPVVMRAAVGLAFMAVVGAVVLGAAMLRQKETEGVPFMAVAEVVRYLAGVVHAAAAAATVSTAAMAELKMLRVQLLEVAAEPMQQGRAARYACGL